MKSRTTLWFLGMVLGIAGIYYLAKDRVPSTEERIEKDRHVVRFKPEDVSELRIQGLNQSFQFTKVQGEWNISQPLQARASQHEIEGVLAILEDLEFRRKLSPASIAEAKLTLADYGLLNPRTVFQMAMGERVVKIHLGNQSRQGDGLYIQVSGDPHVYLVDKELSRRLERKLDDYREKSLLQIQIPQVQRFQIKNTHSFIEFSRTHSLWRMTQPLIARVDQEVVQKLLEQTVAIQAESFLSDDPVPLAEWGLDENAREINFWNAEGEELQGLILGNKLKDDESKVAAKVKGNRSVVAVSVNHWLDTGHPIQDFRDRSLASFEPAEIREVELNTRSTSVLIHRIDGGWKMNRPPGFEVDTEILEKMLQKLSTMMIKEFSTDVLTDLEKYGLKTPSATWILRKNISNRGEENREGRAEEPVLQLALGREDTTTKMLYVKRLDESSIYGLELSEVADLPKDLLRLRSRLLFQIRKENLVSCKLKKGKVITTLDRGEGNLWKLGEGTVGVLNEHALSQFQSLLEFFRVDAIVGTALNVTVKNYGLDPPSAILQVSHRNGSKTAVLELVIGKETTSKKYFLVWKDQVLLCEINPEIHRILTQDWVTKPAEK